MEASAPPARLKSRYLEEIRPTLVQRFGYSSVMQAPRIEKITLNMGVGLAKQDTKMLKAASEQLATIAGQAPSVRRARKSIAAFKLREGMPVGVAVTLRGERSYEFLDRLISVAIPRIRDFRGLNPRSFDGRGNYSMGVREQIIFPEVDYDAIDQIRGLDITITTTAATDPEAFVLLLELGMPFATQGRPGAFVAVAGEDGGAGTPPAGAAGAETAGAEAAPEPELEAEAAVEPEPAAEPEAEAEAAPAEGEMSPADEAEETPPAEEAEASAPADEAEETAPQAEAAPATEPQPAAAVEEAAAHTAEPDATEATAEDAPAAAAEPQDAGEAGEQENKDKESSD